MFKTNAARVSAFLRVLPTAVAAFTAGCGPTGYKIEPVPVDRTIEEATLIHEGGLLPPKIALIDISGLLLDAHEPQLLGEGEHPVSLLVEKLNKAADDPAVRAIVLRINSPGGTVTAADLMHQEVLRIRQQSRPRKPVIAVIMDVGASGAYYVACACDEIIAHPTSVIGSIGVIMQTFNFGGTLEKIGAESVAIKSGKMKDAGSIFRKMTPEERAVFQGIIDEFFDRFVRVVDAGRPGLDAGRIREIADGRVWTAQQALDLGLIDRIGTLRDALAAAREKIGARRVRVVTYHRPLAWKPNIYATGADQAATQVNHNYGLLNVNVPDRILPRAPMFLYLWAPGAY